jgi:hypothetical protein
VRESSRFRAGTVGINVPRACKVVAANANGNSAAVKVSAAASATAAVKP